MSKRSTKLHEKLKKDVLSEPVVFSEYEAFKTELELAKKIKKAHQKADLTQETLAKAK
ncbi:MAG: hypothetical protein AB7F64_02800 [Gammaproteobacteria bacterium]